MEFHRQGTRRTTAVAILVLAGAGLLAAHHAGGAQTPSHPSQPLLESQFQAAMAAEDRGDLERAKHILSGLRRDHPEIFAVNESLGMIYVAGQQYAEALPLLRAAASEQPSSAAAHRNLGANYYQLHRNADALHEFTIAARLDPKNAATQKGLGDLWMDAGKPEYAAGAYEAALRAEPGDPDLALELANALVAAKDFARAEAILDKLPGTDGNADAQVLLGRIAEAKGKFLDAERNYDRAVQLEPSEENAWMLGVEFLRHWTFDAAIPVFQVAVAKFAESTRMKLGLGAAYFGDGKYDRAIQVFAGLSAADKNSALDAELLGMACSAVSDAPKQPCSALIDYAQTHPRDAAASTYAVTMLLTEAAGEEQNRLGRKLLTQALAADARLPDAQYLMGVQKQNDGDWAGSISNLKAAIALEPEMAQAHYRLALAYARTKRKPEAKLEVALQQKYSQQKQSDLDRRLRQITTFVTDAHN